MQPRLGLADLFSPIRGLRGVVVTAVSDCLTFAEWRREGESWSPTEVAATWELMRSHQASLSAIGGTHSMAFTVEAPLATMIFSEVDARFGVTYVFDSGTPLGVARLRVQMLAPTLAERLANEVPEVITVDPAIATPPEVVVPAGPPPIDPPLGVTPPVTSRPAASPRVASPPVASPPVASPPVASPSVASPPVASPSVASPPVASPPVASPPVERKVVVPAPALESTDPRPAPAIATPLPRRSFARSDSGSPPSAATARASQPAPVAIEIDAPKPASMGSKLLAYLERYAPDTHAALLRVSLQTGLPVTLLRQPDKLSADEFSQVAESVRTILGVEQLNL